ncbi:MAG: ATP-binding protein [Microcoleaceae cyanobacterium]
MIGLNILRRWLNQKQVQLPLQQILLIPFVIPMILTVGLTGYLTYRTGQQTIKDLANELMDALGQRVKERLDNYLEDPLVVTRLNGDVMKRGDFSLSNIAQVERRFQLQMQQFDSLQQVYLGTTTGEYLGVYRRSQDTLQTAASDNYRQQLIQSQNYSQSQIKASDITLNTIDLRQRPWYQAAIVSQELSWTPIYQFLQGDFGITASEPFYNRNGELQGVMAVDLVLTVLSDFLNQLKLTRDSEIFILERSGKLVATSTQEKLYKEQLEAVNLEMVIAVESQHPLTQVTFQYLIKTVGSLEAIQEIQHLQFKDNNQKYFLEVLPYSHLGLDWLIVVVVPEVNLIEKMAVTQRRIIVLYLLGFLIVIGLGILTARWINRQIVPIVKASRQMASGKLNQRVKNSPIKEIEILAQSFNFMAEKLDRSVEELEQRVDQRTIQLQEANQLLHQEIWERKQTEKALRVSEDKFSKAFHCSPNPSIITRLSDNIIIEFNGSALEFLGYSVDEVRDKTFNQLGIWVDENSSSVIMNVLQQQGIIRGMEQSVYIQSRQVKTVLLSAEMIYLNSQTCILSILNDITQRKQTELDLAKARDEAEAANQAKSEFLANMSHELRTPLNAILGFSQLMGQDNSLRTEQSKMLQIINNSGEHLLDLINSILDLSKIEAGHMRLEESSFNLYNLLNNLEQMLQFKALSKGLILQFILAPDVPQYIKTDEGKLRQVLINLLSNGIKYTKAGSVTLKIAAQQQSLENEKAQILFEVSDTGVGISSDEINSIFDAFFQSEIGRQSHQGTGLGLSISDQFVEMMGGEITVNSIVGEGTQFKFDIQVDVTTAEEAHSYNQHQKVVKLAENQPNYRILVVDDAWENRQLLSKLFQWVGFQVREAENGAVAVEIWQQWKPHLIWMDMRMPVMNGYKATRQIRSIKSTEKTVIIGLTASAFEQDRETVLAAGCDDFVRKPAAASVLFEKMAQYLGVRYLYAEDIAQPMNSQPTYLASADNMTDWQQQIMQVMSTEWIRQFHQATLIGRDQEMLQLIREIPESNASLAEFLTDLTQSFEFDKILELTAMVETDSSQ